jgi:hypothetical protein
MTKLTDEEFQRLYQLIEKAKERSASSSELRELVELILRSGAQTQYDIDEYIRRAGFASLEELYKHIDEKKSHEAIDKLIAIGLGMLAGYAIIKWLSSSPSSTKRV